MGEKKTKEQNSAMKSISTQISKYFSVAAIEGYEISDRNTRYRNKFCAVREINGIFRGSKWRNERALYYSSTYRSAFVLTYKVCSSVSFFHHFQLNIDTASRDFSCTLRISRNKMQDLIEQFDRVFLSHRKVLLPIQVPSTYKLLMCIQHFLYFSTIFFNQSIIRQYWSYLLFKKKRMNYIY